MTDKTWINLVFRRAIRLARKGQWHACNIVLARNIDKFGFELTDKQREAIHKAVRNCTRYPMGNNQLEEAYADYKI